MDVLRVKKQICVSLKTWSGFCAGGHSSGEGMAPGALRVHAVRDGVGEPQLLREGRTAVLRERLLHPFLSALRPVQQAHPQCESRTCAHTVKPSITYFSCHCNLQVTFCFLQKMVTALDKNWHPECFCCVKCSHSFGEEGNELHFLSGFNSQMFELR